MRQHVILDTLGIMDFLNLTTKTTKNIGDEIQIIAANNLLGEFGATISGEVDRERLSSYSGPKKKLLMNGWYFHNSSYWPPSKDIIPLITSFHLSDLPGEEDGKNPRTTILEKNNRKFITAQPIGARDIEVLRFFTRNNIPAYFSGCLTLTLKPRGIAKKKQICCVDVPSHIVAHIKHVSRLPVVELFNSEIPDGIDYATKMKRAQDTLNTYEKSSVVISSRLHAVLPSLALGTSAILIHNKNKDASRYSGLGDLIRNASEEDFLNGLHNHELIDPSPNSNHYQTIAENLKKIVSAFVLDETVSYEKLLQISQENLYTLINASDEHKNLVREWNNQRFFHNNRLPFWKRKR